MASEPHFPGTFQPSVRQRFTPVQEPFSQRRQAAIGLVLQIAPILRLRDMLFFLRRKMVTLLGKNCGLKWEKLGSRKNTVFQNAKVDLQWDFTKKEESNQESLWD